MLDGTAVHRIPGRSSVLSRGGTSHVLGGVAFSLLKRTLAEFLRGGAAAARRGLRAAGYTPADARQLADLLGHLADDSRPSPERLMSSRALERWLARRAATNVRVRFHPPPDDEPAEGLLLVAPTHWWAGPRAGACVECARLAFAEASFAPGEIGEALDAATHEAIVLSRATRERMAEALVTVGEAGAGWIQGTFGAARVEPREIRHPACRACFPAAAGRQAPSLAEVPPPEGRGGEDEDAAEMAATVLRHLQVHATETLEHPAGAATRRDLPVVTVAWRRAFRDTDGDIAVQEGTQVGGGGSVGRRLLTARAEAIERLLVATRAPDVRGRSLAAMGDPAADPAGWGLFTPEQYGSAGFPFRPFGPEEPLDWVHAWDLAARTWTHVPLDLVNGAAGAHLPASSTGAAAHTSVERIVTNGLLEILEREALQLAWYRGAAPAILPTSRLGGDASEMFAWLEGRRWRVHLRHVRGRAGRHVVCAIGELLVEKPGLRPHGAVFTSGAAGALGRAAARALGELVTAVEGLEAWPPPLDEATDPAAALDAAWLHDDPEPIQRLYLDPAMRPALDFFLAGPPLGDPPPDREDTAEALVQALVREGLRPLYVDCTVPGAAPFHAGKTLLHGALPHSFATGLLRLGAGAFAPPPRVRVPPPPGYRPAPGATTAYPFPLG